MWISPFQTTPRLNVFVRQKATHSIFIHLMNFDVLNVDTNTARACFLVLQGN